jgi:hypothetical protein
VARDTIIKNEPSGNNVCNRKVVKICLLKLCLERIAMEGNERENKKALINQGSLSKGWSVKN